MEGFFHAVLFWTLLNVADHFKIGLKGGEN